MPLNVMRYLLITHLSWRHDERFEVLRAEEPERSLAAPVTRPTCSFRDSKAAFRVATVLMGVRAIDRWDP